MAYVGLTEGVRGDSVGDSDGGCVATLVTGDRVGGLDVETVGIIVETVTGVGGVIVIGGLLVTIMPVGDNVSTRDGTDVTLESEDFVGAIEVFAVGGLLP